MRVQSRARPAKRGAKEGDEPLWGGLLGFEHGPENSQPVRGGGDGVTTAVSAQSPGSFPGLSSHGALLGYTKGNHPTCKTNP